MAPPRRVVFVCNLNWKLKAMTKFISICAVFRGAGNLIAQSAAPQFNVIAFYTGKEDLAHISFVKEANKWFPEESVKHHFSYEATTNWNDLNANYLSRY